VHAELFVLDYQPLLLSMPVNGVVGRNAAGRLVLEEYSMMYNMPDSLNYQLLILPALLV
jgi:hypothetical protein